MQQSPYRSSHHRDPNSFAMALAVERGSVYWAPGAVGIPLKRKGARTGDFVLVSFEDRGLSQYYWSESRWGYPRRRDKTGGQILIHRQIMGLTPGDGLHVDHINRDRFDNRRENLRVVSAAENGQNQGSRVGSTSPFRGVSFNTRTGRWIAAQSLRGKLYHLGSYETEREAADAALAWRKVHMPFAVEGPTSRYRGVSWDSRRRKWLAQAKLNYKPVFIGRFDTEEEAAAAARAWRTEHMPFSED